MPKYSYTVINQEGQKLTGTIEAESEKAAHDSLSKLGFPILNITLLTQDTSELSESTSQKFEFQAVDQNSRKVTGSIAAGDIMSAFKRLINEYHFAVEQLYPASLSAEAKEEQRKRGVVELYTALKKEDEKSGKDAKNEEEQMRMNQVEKNKETLRQTDFVLQKVDGLLREFGDAIKPEDKMAIQKKSDRLIRLKTSKNSDYVKHLAEDLLLYIQNEEIFLTHEKNDKRIETFRLDVKKLMSEIHREKIGVSLRQDILNMTSMWLANHLKNNDEPSWWEKILGNMMNFINNLLTEPPQVTELKEKIRVMSRQIWDYYFMYIRETTLENRKDIKESIRGLKEQKEELKLKLRQMQQKIAEESEALHEESSGDKVTAELVSATGWLMGIYFILHVAYFYSKSKDLPIKINFESLNITQSQSFLVALLVLLLLHAGLRIRQMLKTKKIFADLIVIPIVTFSILIVIINF
jgi:succinate dehydrogenase hydrophobic anchor subunit